MLSYFRWVLFFVALFATLMGGALYLGHALLTAEGPLQATKTVVIPRGAGPTTMAKVLQEEGIISHSRLFRIALMIDEMVKRGISDDEMCSIFQGVKLQSAAFAMERKLKDGIFWHGGQPMMAWCVGNAKVEQRRNDVLITKEAAGKAKIDPLLAAFNAAYLMSLNPEAARSAVSPWENPDFRLAAS